MKNVINWFEIPVINFERAKAFYDMVMVTETHEVVMNGERMAFFSHKEEGVGGALIESKIPGYSPSRSGVKIYLNGGEDLQPFLERVEQAGGKIVMPKTKITDEIGFCAFFEDTEGNQLAFHSRR